jgi:hypothetical protein
MTQARRTLAAPAVVSAILVGGLLAAAVAGAHAARAETGTIAPATASASPLVLPGSTSAAVATLGGFTTPMPPDPATAWTGISWRALEAGDPLAQIRSVLRWRGGFVALGAEVIADDGWRTPAWVSTDGVTWRPLGADVFGPTTIVLGIGETPDGLAALTLHSGTNQCADSPVAFSCWTLAAPLKSWTSADATTWMPHPGPADIALPDEGCGECGVGAPIVRSGAPGLLAVNSSGTPSPTGSRVALSRDGIGWESIPADAIPAGFDFNDVAATGSGFIATGEQGVSMDGEDTIRAVVLLSEDGRTWSAQDLPTSGLQPRNGSSAGRVVVGPRGLIVTGSDAMTPGTELWWSSASGGAWTRLEGYPPLGVWTGEAEGSGLIPDGTLIGNGERLIAYRSGASPAAWMSSDGSSWQAMTVTGAGPTNSGDWPLDAHGRPGGLG